MTTQSDTQNYASEFLTGHFGYTPLALVDDYVNHFNEPVGGIMDAIEDFFVAILAEQGLDIDSDGKSQNEVRGGIHRLQTLLEHLIDKNVDKLEIYLLRNILTIPSELGCTPTAFLPHYRALDVADGDEESTHVGMAALEEKRDELTKLEKINRKLRSIHRIKQRNITRLDKETEQRRGVLAYLRNAADKHVTLSANLRSLHNNHLQLKESDPFAISLQETSNNDSTHAHRDKALWQFGRIGYLNWQTGRLVKDESVNLVTREFDGIASLNDLHDFGG